MDYEKYIQASISIRVYEKDLLTKVDFDSLVDSPTLHKALMSLQDTVYKDSIQALKRDEDYESILSKELKRVYDRVEEVSPDKSIINYLKETYVFHNLKLLVKEIIQDENYKSIYSNLVDMNTLEYKEDIKNNVIDNDYVRYARIALDEYEKTKNPQVIDIVLDNFYFQKLLSYEQLDFLNEFTKEKIDLINIKTLFRAMKRGVKVEDLLYSLIEGGNIPVKDFTEVLFQKPEAAVDAFSRYNVIKYVKKALENRDDYILDLEKAIDDHQMDMIKKSKTITYGPELIFGYILAKETEIKNLRIILVAKLNSLEKGFIRERLRESYV